MSHISRTRLVVHYGAKPRKKALRAYGAVEY
jgi:hypothetical protein